MFIGLTPYDNRTKTKYYNTEYIKSFEYSKEGFTVLTLTYGTDIVRERPEDIINIMKEND